MTNILSHLAEDCEETDYSKYRGKCKQYVDKLIEENPKLVAVRGFYHCPVWGKQQHWWAKDEDGKIIDPTVKQFPTKGICAEYEEFDGYFECENCGKSVHEEEAYFVEHHIYCCSRCYMKDVGF
jgi:hypothetical protein